MLKRYVSYSRVCFQSLTAGSGLSAAEVHEDSVWQQSKEVCVPWQTLRPFGSILALGVLGLLGVPVLLGAYGFRLRRWGHADPGLSGFRV